MEGMETVKAMSTINLQNNVIKKSSNYLLSAVLVFGIP